MQTMAELQANINYSLILDRLERLIKNNQAEVAHEINKSKRWLQRKLRADVSLTLKELLLICQSANIDPADLFN